MTNRDVWSGNVSPSTGRAYENRFDYEPVEHVPNPHDTARQAVYEMPEVEYQLLTLWVKHALKSDATRVGWHRDDADRGGSYTDDLIGLAGPDIGFEPSRDEIKGALLLSGRSFLPTFSTAYKASWRVPCTYVGIEYGGPVWSEMANLQAQL